MTQARFTYEAPGAAISQILGPTTNQQSIPAAQFKPGETLEGDGGAVFVFCSLVLGSTTSLTPGQLYTIDKNFVATLLSTANSPRGTSVGVCQVYQANVVAGTYYIWLQIKGHAPVAAAASSAANALAETTATAGTANFTNSPTVSSKLILGLYLLQASQTFTATTVNGSYNLTLVPGTNIGDIALNAAISGTGIPASTVITSITKVNDGSYTLGMNNAATANGTAITITAVGVITGQLSYPFIDKTN